MLFQCPALLRYKTLLSSCDNLDLAQHSLGQVLHCHAGSGRSLFLKIAAVDLVELGEVRDVCQETGSLDDVAVVQTCLF